MFAGTLRCVLIGVVAGGAALAQVGEPTAQKADARPNALRNLLDEADMNGDEKLTLEEIRSVRPRFPQTSFDRMDRNGDGMVTADERAPATGRRGGKMMDSLLRMADTDGDAKVTLKEAQTIRPAMNEDRFRRLDRDGDGFLSAKDQVVPTRALGGVWPSKKPAAGAPKDAQLSYAEIVKAKPEFPKAVFDLLDVNGDGVLSALDARRGAGRMGQGNVRRGRAQVFDRLQGADADGDGKTTYDEARKVAPRLTQENFDRLDRNKDGVLTLDDRMGREPRRLRESGGDGNPEAGESGRQE